MKKSRKLDVIKAASCLMRTHGYSHLNFTEISQSLGVTRENIHYYFKKKEDLGLACLEYMKEDFEQKLQDLASCDATALEKLQMYFLNYKWNKTHKEDCPIVSFLSEYQFLPLSMQKEIVKLCEIEHKYLEVILNEGKVKKEFRFIHDSKLKAKIIISLLKGAVGYAKIYNNFDDTTQYILEDLTG